MSGLESLVAQAKRSLAKRKAMESNNKKVCVGNKLKGESKVTRKFKNESSFNLTISYDDATNKINISQGGQEWQLTKGDDYTAEEFMDAAEDPGFIDDVISDDGTELIDDADQGFVDDFDDSEDFDDEDFDDEDLDEDFEDDEDLEDEEEDEEEEKTESFSKWDVIKNANRKHFENLISGGKRKSSKVESFKDPLMQKIYNQMINQ